MRIEEEKKDYEAIVSEEKRKRKREYFLKYLFVECLIKISLLILTC